MLRILPLVLSAVILALGAEPALAQRGRPVTAVEVTNFPTPALRTHVNSDVRSFVVLRRQPDVTGGCGLQESEFFRVGSNGRREDTPFRVPAGQILVATDVDWWIADFTKGVDKERNDVRYFDLSIEFRDGPFVSNLSVLRSSAFVDFQGRSGRSEHMTTGVAVASGSRLCASAQVFDNPDLDELRVQVIVRGYLIPDPDA